MNDLSELRERLERWRLLTQRMTDARALEALRVETAELKEKIGRLEASEAGQSVAEPLNGHNHI